MEPKMRTPPDKPTTKEKIRAVGQIALGLAQVMAATVALYLLVTTGINDWSISAAALTGLLIVTSRILFGGGRGSNGGR
jgi:hypothetical protein